MTWVEESDDPRTAAIAGVLTGTAGLDSSDVWSLTRKIIAALDAPVPVEVTEPALPPRPSGAALEGKRWWLSWYNRSGDWALWFPWWISGYDSEGREIVVAAVIAPSEEEAWEVIYNAYFGRPSHLEQRFIEELPEGKSPFSDRFPRADWNVWPE